MYIIDDFLVLNEIVYGDWNILELGIFEVKGFVIIVMIWI